MMSFQVDFQIWEKLHRLKLWGQDNWKIQFLFYSLGKYKSLHLGYRKSKDIIVTRDIIMVQDSSTYNFLLHTNHSTVFQEPHSKLICVLIHSLPFKHKFFMNNPVKKKQRNEHDLNFLFMHSWQWFSWVLFLSSFLLRAILKIFPSFIITVLRNSYTLDVSQEIQRHSFDCKSQIYN